MAQELSDKEDKVGYLKERFASKMNGHYEEKGFSVSKDRIFFTDWEAGDEPEMKKLGICGVSAIREVIRSYLLDQRIYEEGDKELEDLFSRT